MPKIVFCAILNEEDKLLLLHRTKHRKHAPDTWHCMGGTIEEGESANETLRRELVEELGIKEFVVLKGAKPFLDKHYDPPYEVFPFLIRVSQPIKVDTREHDKWEWVCPDKVSKLEKLHPALVNNLSKLGIRI